jgi:hypothetical protein
LSTSPKPDGRGRALFERIVPAWREALPSTVPRDYFDRFVVRNRDALLRRFDTFAAQTGARPRASKEALAALAGRLGFMPKSVRVGDTSYHSATWTTDDGEIEITFRGDRTDVGVTKMILYVAPRDAEELDLRGVLLDAMGEPIARFDGEVIARPEIILLRETLLARWFGVTTTPERRMPPSMLEALAVLRAEEYAANDKYMTHPWQGVHDLIKDALIARGLAVSLVASEGPPRYQTTPEGRRRLAEANTHSRAPVDWDEVAEEEARMGRALRAERDREEGPFTESLQRGMAYEKTQGLTGWDARSRVFQNLEIDPQYYDKPQPASARRFAPAMVYPLRFSQEGLSDLFKQISESNLASRFQVAGYTFDRASLTIDETGFVLLVYQTAGRENPRPVKLASGIETKPFVPGGLVVYLTPKGSDIVFSIELKRDDGHQVVSSNWVKGSLDSIARLSSDEVADLIGLERPSTNGGSRRGS